MSNLEFANEALSRVMQNLTQEELSNAQASAKTVASQSPVAVFRMFAHTPDIQSDPTEKN